jgi:putative FmdB family regulatory protein
MPIYEYRCEHCGDFEVTQRITEDPLKKCPTCKRKVRKLISTTSFQLKGSGWYVTDYARAGKEKGGTKEKGGEASATSESGAGGESKGEHKGEQKSERPAKKASAPKAA